MPTRKRRRKIGWEQIEREYRTGVLSVMDIARQHGITDGAIHNKARRKEWTRDLSNQVRQRARDKLVRESVRPRNAREDSQTVEESAEIIVRVVREHRAAITRMHGIVATMMEWAERYIEACDTKDDKKREAALEELHISGLFGGTDALPGVADKLSRTLGRLIDLERQAFNLDATDNKPSDHIPLAERLRELRRDREIEKAPNVEHISGAATGSYGTNGTGSMTDPTSK